MGACVSGCVGVCLGSFYDLKLCLNEIHLYGLCLINILVVCIRLSIAEHVRIKFSSPLPLLAQQKCHFLFHWDPRRHVTRLKNVARRLIRWRTLVVHSVIYWCSWTHWFPNIFMLTETLCNKSTFSCRLLAKASKKSSPCRWHTPRRRQGWLWSLMCYSVGAEHG